MTRPNERIGLERPVLELCAEAGDMLRAAGFEFVNASMQSESTYYRLPGRHGLLRISSHPFRKSHIGLGNVVASVTFRGGRRARHVLVCSHMQIENMLWTAVGQYVLRSVEASPPRLRGPGVRAAGNGVAMR